MSKQKHSPLPWRGCGEDSEKPCKCGMVWSPDGDHPVLTIERGEWGDEWPSLRLVGDSSFDRKAEAYMEKSAYGNVPDDVADANMHFVVKAANLHYELVAMLDLVQWSAEADRCPVCDASWLRDKSHAEDCALAALLNRAGVQQEKNSQNS